MPIFENNVKTTLYNGLTALGSVITVNNQSAPLKPPPSPAYGTRVKMTITDDAFNPTNVEIVSYGERTQIGGNWQLLDCHRGEESTSARAWPAESIVYQAYTKDFGENYRKAIGSTNLIDNPSFNVFKADATYTVGPSGVTAAYPVQRWRVEAHPNNALNILAKRVRLAGQAQDKVHSLRLTSKGTSGALSGSEYYILSHRIEGYDFEAMRYGSGALFGRTAVLSFDVMSSLTGTYHVAFRNGRKDRSMVMAYRIGTPNVFERKTLVVQPDYVGVWNSCATATVGMEISWVMRPLALASGMTTSASSWWWTGNFLSKKGVGTDWGSTDGATWHISGVDFRAGDVALEAFHPNTMAHDVAKCLRYYETSYDMGRTAGAASSFYGIELTNGYIENPGIYEVTVNLRVPKRVTPTYSFWSPVTGASGFYRQVTNTYDGTAYASYQGLNSFVLTHSIPTGSGRPIVLYAHWEADAEL